MDIINVLVFPCGSEIGLEVHNAMKFDKHINLVGLSSVPSHAKMVYKNYIEGVSFINDPGFMDELNKIIDENDTVRFYTNEGKTFSRVQSAIGRPVYQCHPPAKQQMVRKMIESFKSGAKDHVDVWLPKGDRPHSPAGRLGVRRVHLLRRSVLQQARHD